MENWRLSAFIPTVRSMLLLCFLWISSFAVLPGEMFSMFAG